MIVDTLAFALAVDPIQASRIAQGPSVPLGLRNNPWIMGAMGMVEWHAAMACQEEAEKGQFNAQADLSRHLDLALSAFQAARSNGGVCGLWTVAEASIINSKQPPKSRKRWTTEEDSESSDDESNETQAKLLSLFRQLCKGVPDDPAGPALLGMFLATSGHDSDPETLSILAHAIERDPFSNDLIKAAMGLLSEHMPHETLLKPLLIAADLRPVDRFVWQSLVTLLKEERLKRPHQAYLIQGDEQPAFVPEESDLIYALIQPWMPWFWRRHFHECSIAEKQQALSLCFLPSHRSRKPPPPQQPAPPKPFVQPPFIEAAVAWVERNHVDVFESAPKVRQCICCGGSLGNLIACSASECHLSVHPKCARILVPLIGPWFCFEHDSRPSGLKCWCGRPCQNNAEMVAHQAKHKKDSARNVVMCGWCLGCENGTACQWPLKKKKMK